MPAEAKHMNLWLGIHTWRRGAFTGERSPVIDLTVIRIAEVRDDPMHQLPNSSAFSTWEVKMPTYNQNELT